MKDVSFMGLRLTHGHIPPFRESEITVPKSPVALPYTMRQEMTWHDFTNWTNPLGAPREIIHAMQDSLVTGELDYAPDPLAHELRSALSKKLDVSEKCIVVAASIEQLIRLITQTFLPGRVAIPVPCPVSYLDSVQYAGHSVSAFKMGVTMATPQLKTAYTTVGSFNGVILGNPSFPASRSLTQKTVMHYADACDWVIVDESYLHLSYSGSTVLPLIKKYKNIIILRNLSATYGMPGVPISYMVADEDLASHIKESFEGSANTMFTEVMSDFILHDDIYREYTHDLMDAEIPWMHSMLSKTPQMKAFSPDGNYILCKFKPDQSMHLGAMSSQELLHKLKLKGFLLQDMQEWPGMKDQGYFCVAIRKHEENEKLVNAMRKTIVVKMHL